jgi:hypothetical protein
MVHHPKICTMDGRLKSVIVHHFTALIMTGRSWHLTGEYSGLGKYAPRKEQSPTAYGRGFSGR